MSVLHGIVLVALCSVFLIVTDPVEGKTNCSPFIPLIYAPTCGSDGVMYGNYYEMKYAACVQNITITEADPGTCPDFDDY